MMHTSPFFLGNVLIIVLNLSSHLSRRRSEFQFWIFFVDKIIKFRLLSIETGKKFQTFLFTKIVIFKYFFAKLKLFDFWNPEKNFSNEPNFRP